MKVDLGTCAVCGAKNSKFVEVCYKCGAPLPWAPNFVAPKSQTPSPSSANPAPAPQSRPTPPQSPGNPVSPSPGSPAPTSNPKNEAKTVVIPSTPANVSSVDAIQSNSLTPNRVPAKVQVPTWAIAAGVLGCVVLGMLLMTVFGRGSNGTAPIVVPTVAATPQATDNATPLPQTTPQGTSVAPSATVAPVVVAPTQAPVATSPAPIATADPGAPVVASTPVLPGPANVAGTAAPVAPVAVHGPPYDEVAARMEGNSSTDAQKQLYWQGVVGSTVSWSGQITNVELNNSGRITLRCGNQSTKGNVLVTLDGSQATSMANIVVGQRITVEGTLQDHSPLGYTLTNGRITSFS